MENADKNNIEEDIPENNVPVEDKGMGTDTLSPEELQKLVDNNPELKEIEKDKLTEELTKKEYIIY